MPSSSHPPVPPLSFTTLDAMAPSPRHWLRASLAWMDRHWDEPAGLIRYPGPKSYGNVPDPTRAHLVRESLWYALGLLMRDSPADRRRAGLILGTLARLQFNSPGKPQHGSFPRCPEEPAPPDDAQIWRDYDPNWREFIGTALLLLLDAFPQKLTEPQSRSIDAMIRLAAEGAFIRDVHAEYTNIALMSAYLLDAAGTRLHEPAWTQRGQRLADQVHARWLPNRAFDEFNAPTYYGIDLAALEQWRRSPSTSIRHHGEAMLAELWRDIARFYHPAMRNLCGPFDRAYGLDLRRCVGNVALFIAMIVEPADAPLPAFAKVEAQAHDFCYMPLAALLGSHPPADAESFTRPPTRESPRRVERLLPGSPARRASACLGPRVMYGGMEAGLTRPAMGQGHPATIHWLGDRGSVGWVRLRWPGPADAFADARGLHLRVSAAPADANPLDGVVFEIHPPHAGRVNITAQRWRLPRLAIDIQTAAPLLGVEQDGPNWRVRYAAPVVGGEAFSFTLQPQE